MKRKQYSDQLKTKMDQLITPLNGWAACSGVGLSFTHPITGVACRFDTGIPEKFLQIFRSTKRSDNP